MKINVNSLTYNFDGDKITGVTVGFNGNSNGNFLSATILITSSDLSDGKTFDDVTKSELTDLAHTKLTEFLTIKEAGE